MEEYLVYILPPIFATFGFVMRYIWDFYINRRKRELQEKIKLIEYRLKEFYYPIFFYLKREQIIWDKILKLHQIAVAPENININIYENGVVPSPYCRRPSRPEQTDQEIELVQNHDDQSISISNNQIPPHVHAQFQLIKALDEENLKIHKIVQQFIHDKISIALPPKHLVKLLMQYDEHVTVYQILRAMDIYDRFPAEYDAPYPHNILIEVNKRILELDKEYIIYNNRLG